MSRDTPPFPRTYWDQRYDDLAPTRKTLESTPPASETVEAAWKELFAHHEDAADYCGYNRASFVADRQKVEAAIRAEADPWASTGDGLTPNERLSLAHKSGIEVGRAEADERVRALREAATALCQLWFTDNAPDGSQHLRKAMLDLRAALSDTAEDADA